MLVIPVTLAPIFVPQLHGVLGGGGRVPERLEAALRLRSF